MFDSSGGRMAQPPDRRLTAFTQHQRVSEWLDSIDRPDGMQFLDLDTSVLMGFLRRLDTKTRSSLERTCKSLLSLSRSSKPRLQSLTIHFTTTWNHDSFVEVTARFSADHSFHAVFMCKKKTPNWMTGGWSTERRRKITAGSWSPEKLRLGHTFVERTSKYIEYWLRNFQTDTLKIKVENLIPGKEHEIQQMNYTGAVPNMKLKKFILHGANNIRFINNWLNNLVPSVLESRRKPIDVELIDVGKLDQIFHHPLLTSGNVNLSFHRVTTHFTRKTFSFVNIPVISIVARKVPSEAVNAFLKRWSRGEITDEFRYLHITETTPWTAQTLQMASVLKGIRCQLVELATNVPLRVLRPECEIFQVSGPRPGFCVQSKNEFIFEVPSSSELSGIAIDPPVIQSNYDVLERQRSRIYMELFRKRLIRLFN